MIWKPHATVAAVIEKDNRFLLVEEKTAIGLAYNQPAGHLEAGESLLDAVKREVLEETAWQFEPEELLSVQLWRKSPTSPSFLRFCFTGKVHSYDPDRQLDTGIIGTHWLSQAEIENLPLRSPLVLLSIQQYFTAARYPLTLLHTFLDLA